MTAENASEDSSSERLDPRSLSIQGSVSEGTVVVGDRNTINQGPSYYTTNVFGTFEPEQFPARPSQPLNQEEYRWRQVLVQNVKRYWIEGVLEKSLHNQALIELGLEERAQAVAAPIGAAEEFVEDTGRAFPVGTQATDIFDGLGAGRTLLILGEPGAGKTTTLLKLTKTLIARIGDDFSQPIPVVLNLSSWAKKRNPIAEWLVQDLYETFQVSKSLGTAWIKEEQLTLCLDGLDEVAVEHRNACVQALNQFLQTHGRTEVVVCSRIRDYETLSERLRVKCAIYVQPLTAQQIDQYLEQAGEQLLALNTVLEHSLEIKAFAASPLMLSVMSLAYQGCSIDEFSVVDNAREFRQRLFDTYIKRMFLRRGKTHGFTDRQAKYWLVWMAQRMVQASQTVFFVENMQPIWFQTWAQKLWYRLESALIVGLFVGFFVGMVYGLMISLITGLINGLVVGLAAALIAGVLGNIHPVETLKWSSMEAKKALPSWLSVGVLIGLAFGLTYGWLTGDLIYEIRNGLIGGLIAGLLAGLSVGLKGPTMQQKTRPNQGIWKSAQNAAKLSLIGGFLFGLIYGLIAGLRVGLSDGSRTGLILGLKNGLIFGLISGLIYGLIAGGMSCLRHFTLRLMLYRFGYSPWNYARFLDYAAERLFLRKVGGGYIFIHRMLLEHFAQMVPEQKPLK